MHKVHPECDCCTKLEALKAAIAGGFVLFLFFGSIYVHDLARHAAIDRELEHAHQSERWAAAEYAREHGDAT